jgi:aminopeptidase
MLNTVQLERYAEVLLWGLTTARTQKFKKHDIVLIRCDPPAIALGEKVFAKLMELKMHPVMRITGTPTIEKSFFELADSAQLTFKVPGDEALYTSLNGGIYLNAPASLTHLSAIDPKRIGQATISRKYLRDILDKLEEQGAFGWTLCMFPTEELAKHAGMDIKEYSGQIIKACLLNKANPVKEWKAIYRSVGEIKKWLNSLKVKTFHIESASVDLEITPGEKRKWIGISGHNIPSFEIFLSPDWRGTQGRYYADQPSYRSGNLVKGVRLEFKNGAAVKIEAASGAEFTRKQLAMDKGANKVGEFSLTDKRFSKIDRFMANTLFDENFGGKNGNCHIAVGASYSDTYSGDPATLTKEKKEKLGFNDSALHWDLVNTEKKRVSATLSGGKRIVIYENGVFTY